MVENESHEAVAATVCIHETNYAYMHCPYRYPCGSAPCEKGDECPAKTKKVKIIPQPYVPPKGPTDWPPGTIIYSQSTGYAPATGDTTEGGE